MGNLLSPQRALYETNPKDHMVALLDVQRAYWSLSHDERTKLNFMLPNATNYDIESVHDCLLDFCIDSVTGISLVDIKHETVKCNNNILKNNFKFYKTNLTMIMHMTSESVKPWQFMILSDKMYALLFSSNQPR